MLRLLDFLVGCQPHAPAAFTPRNFLVLIFTRGWVDPRATVWSEGNMSPPGIEPETVRLVAQRLNHYVTPGPIDILGFLRKCLECESFPWINWTGEQRSNLSVYFYITHLFTRSSPCFPRNWSSLYIEKTKVNKLNWVYSKNRPSYSTFSVQQCLVVTFVIAPLYW